MSGSNSRLKTVLSGGPHLAVALGSGTSLSVTETRRGRRAAAGCPSGPRDGPSWRWAGAEKRRGRGVNGQAAGGEVGPSPSQGGRGEFPFPFSKFMFCSNPLKRNSKTTLNRKNSTQSKYMQQHECTYMFLDLIVDFISTKIISYYFSVLTSNN